MLGTFKVIAQLPPDSLGAYVISMAHTASDVLAVVLLQVRQHVHVLVHLHLAVTVLPATANQSRCS